MIKYHSQIHVAWKGQRDMLPLIGPVGLGQGFETVRYEMHNS